MSIHEGNYYLCDQCDHQATFKNSLIRHWKSSPPKYKIHILNETTKKKHICEICDYKAKRSDIIKNYKAEEKQRL